MSAPAVYIVTITRDVGVVASEPALLRLTVCVLGAFAQYVLQEVLNAALPPSPSLAAVSSDRASPSLWRRCCASLHMRRVLINLVILGLIIAVPNLTQIMAFTGSLASTAVVFIIPLSCHLKVRHTEAQAGRYVWRSFYWLAVGHGSVLLLGVVGGAMGFATTALWKCGA